jgi:cell division protein FtsN
MRNEKRGDLDIYKSTRKSDGTWSDPENVGDIINTPFDDNFPYLHSDGSSMYFASKGHYSMGGYDIYRTVWSWEKKQWSKPENLGFPINSTADDFFFVPSPDEKYSFFSSSRECNADELFVFKIKYINDNSPLEQVGYNELIKISKLDINITDKSDLKSDKNNKPKNDQSEIVKLKDRESFLFKNEYDSLLNEAMRSQLKADSLKWVIDSKRSQLGDFITDEQKQKLSNEIIQLESNIYSMQKIADQLYERVREIEQKNLASKTSSYEVKQEKSTTESELKNQSKTNTANATLIDSVVFKRIEQIKTDENEIPAKESELGFYTKTPSIYNSKNPIPTNEKLPKGIVYMIQLGAFNSVKSPESFHGFTPISCITKQGSNLRKYYTGKFLMLKEAEKALPKIKAKGYKDAYIVAFNNGKVIPINDAVKLETKQPTGFVSENKIIESNQIDPEELSIQYALKFELNNEDTVLLNKIKIQLPDKVKTNKELKGNILFISIEWFVSFEEAYTIKKKLEPIVNKEVEVHAFFGESKIPIDQARKMTQ